MAVKKILFFTAGEVPTVAEAAEIAKIQAYVDDVYLIGVRRSGGAVYQGGSREPAEFVAALSDSLIPAAYKAPNAVTVFDPDAPPAPLLPSNQAVVTDGVAIEITGGTVELTIVDGEITGGTFTADP